MQIYFITILFYLILFFCGITIIRRAAQEDRFQMLVPCGAIFGIALYIFLINLIAHFVKGTLGFYLALAIEILIAILTILKTQAEPISFPRDRNLILFLIYLLILVPFLIFMTTTSGAPVSSDAFMHYSLASIFSRGDYPIHVPWQPDYISYYHLGVAEILGALRSLTGGSYEFLLTSLELIVLICISFILSWFYKTDKPSFLLFFVTLAVGIFTLGSLWLAWPTALTFPNIEGNLFNYLKQLPTLPDAFPTYGTPNNFDSFLLFPHRLISVAFFLTTLVILLLPKRGFLSLFVMAILLAATALSDETTFVAGAPVIFLISIFTLFKKSLLKLSLFISVCALVIILQGGIISYLIFNPNNTPESDILIFPKDQTGPRAAYESYRSGRLMHYKSKFLNNQKYYPLNFFNLGIIWRIAVITIIALVLLRKFHQNRHIVVGILIFSLSSLVSLIEFNAIVPKGYLNANGLRFMGLSYYLSALAIIYLIYLFWDKIRTIKFMKASIFLLKIIIIWILFISIIPPIAILFPRESYNHLTKPKDLNHPIFTWIKENIPQKDRILILINTFPTTLPYIYLIKETGAFTSIWPPQIRSFYGLDISPTYLDVFFTLNPGLLKLLKVQYIVIDPLYQSQLPEERISDLNNSLFFQTVYSLPFENLKILKIRNDYLEQGKDLAGTLTELPQLAPREGSYYIESPPAIQENIYRATRLALIDRKVYYERTAAFYNFQIDATLTYYGEGTDYNYLVLDKNTDPRKFCNCNARLIWSGIGNGLRLWKTES